MYAGKGDAPCIVLECGAMSKEKMIKFEGARRELPLNRRKH